MFRFIRHSLGILLFFLAISVLVWGEWHFPRQIKTMSIDPSEFSVSHISADIPFTPEAKTTETPISTQTVDNALITEDNTDVSSYRLILESPLKIRVGDADIIHLTIAPEKFRIQQTATPLIGFKNESENNTFTQGDATYNILAETRLELDGMLFEPAGDIIEPFRPDETLSIYWTVQPEDAGVNQGAVWLHFQYVAEDQSEPLRRLISTQLIEIKSEGFLGLRGDGARLIGCIGSIIGLALNIDLWIDLYYKIKGRRRIIIHA
jgi:hypothetical protein